MQPVSNSGPLPSGGDLGGTHGLLESGAGGSLGTLEVGGGAGPLEAEIVAGPLDASIGSGGVDLDFHLAVLLALSAIGSLVVFTLAAAAFKRRKSLPYLLITAALGALVLRPIVGTGTALGYVPMQTHHVVEHLLDVIIAGLLIAAIVAVGRLESPALDQPADGGHHDD